MSKDVASTCTFGQHVFLGFSCGRDEINPIDETQWVKTQLDGGTDTFRLHITYSDQNAGLDPVWARVLLIGREDYWIECIGENRREYWIAENRCAAHGWNVLYSLSERAPISLAGSTIEECRSSLYASASRHIQIALQFGFENISRMFQDVLEVLDGKGEVSDPQWTSGEIGGLDAENARLLFAARKVPALHNMGSWGDNAFSIPDWDADLAALADARLRCLEYVANHAFS